MIHDIIKKSIPEYTCELPVTKKEIKFRPLLVKEEKFIAQINELSEKFSDRLYSLCKLVNSCCEETIDSIQLPIYDFQYLLVDIRKRSITEETCMQLVSSVLVELETENKTIDLKTETKEEKIKMLESMSRDQYKIIKEYVLNGFFIMNFNYQTSDGIERTVKVSDFANFLRFYLGTLI